MLGGGAAVKASTGAGSEPAAALTPWATLGPWRGVEDGK
jgi:hypothetical protein